MIATNVKNIAVCDGLVVSNLNFGLLSPFMHWLFKRKAVVNCIVLKFFVLNLVSLQFETKINPVEDIKHFDRDFHKLHINLAIYDVNCYIRLDLHHILVDLLSWERSNVLDQQILVFK